MDSSPGGSGTKQPSSSAPLPPPSSSWDKDQDARRPSSQSQLLPPLELMSSSPGLPNATSTRRQSRPGSSSKGPSAAAINNNNLNSHAYLKYPTPVPTSSTGILSSSPPRVAQNAANTRHAPQRAPSVVSERAPLSAMPSIDLNENGDTVLMGRSSNSSHYQLSANRLISRIHVKARYVPASVPLQPNKIEVECNGWNGLKLHCQGRSYDMHKGEVLTFETEGAEIMVDVQDARVLLHWPKRDVRDTLADLGWEDSPRSVRNGLSPVPGDGSPRARAAANGVDVGLGLLQSSPLRRAARISSPVSPTPANASFHQSPNGDAPSNSQHSSVLSDLPSISERDQSVEIYEDEDVDQAESVRRPSTANQSFITDVSKSFSSDLSDVLSDEENMDENDPNEENDPIITSFGPYGANLNSRMASFSAASPKRRRLDSGAYTSSSSLVENSRRSSKSASTPRADDVDRKGSPTPTPDDHNKVTSYPSDTGKEPVVVPDLSHVDVATITNHVINQLAFSRLSSNPLSTLLSNLPAEDKRGLSREELKYIVEVTTCIGTIERQGKDADGKALESQYYYVPERDSDENRRAAVVDGLRKPTLRNCRKHHVQYYWKRPRTP
ncbi:target of SBF [Gnomoniopsis sp. IMI 355080]|nr:target of SBF [Gnomoniopsis sp. IMI 355080]